MACSMDCWRCRIWSRMPPPGPMTAVPAATPTPTSLSSCWSSANICTKSSSDNISCSFLSALFFFPHRRPSVLLVGVHCQLYVDLREYREYVGLDDRYEDLERIENYRHGHGDERHDGAEVQDKTEEDEDDQVPRQDVGIESHSQGERLGDELLEGFDEKHERDHDHLERHTGGHKGLK